MEDSILAVIKKLLGIPEDYTAFDVDVMTHINSAFSTLTQLGIGPAIGFMIEDDSAVWADFLDTDVQLNPVKTYIALRVRQVFDPPTTSYVVAAFNEQIKELEWRLNIHREETGWVDPDPPVIVIEEV
jgi:hypothetical protein